MGFIETWRFCCYWREYFYWKEATAKIGSSERGHLLKGALFKGASKMRDRLFQVINSIIFFSFEGFFILLERNGLFS